MLDNSNNGYAEIKLEGRLKSDLINRQSRAGNKYYFAFLANEESQQDTPLFFWEENFSYEDNTKLQELRKDQQITVYGFYKETPGYTNPLFQVKRFEAEPETEIFS